MMTNHLPTTVEQLLSYSGVEFIRYAYLCLLGRIPDETGKNYYLSKLFNGFKKVDILIEIRYSKEGKRKDVNMPKMNYLRWLYLWKKVFVLKIFKKCRKENIRTELQEMNAKYDLLYEKLLELEQMFLQKIHVNRQALKNKEKIYFFEKNYQELKLISPRAKEIYFQLKNAVANTKKL